MKKTIYTVITLVLLAISSFSAERNEEFVSRYKPQQTPQNKLRIPMSFDSDSLLRCIPLMEMGKIYQVDYVATGKEGEITNYQHYLDRQRWSTLKKLLKINKIDFPQRTIYQTRFRDEKEAKRLFHGFVIYFDYPESKCHELAFSSLAKMMTAMNGGERIDLSDAKKNSVIEIDEESNVLKDIGKKDKHLPHSVIYLDTLTFKSISLSKKKHLEEIYDKRKQIVDWTYDSIDTKRIIHGARALILKVSSGLFFTYKGLKSTSLFAQLNRANPDDSTLIVTDMTGSMFPYYSQLMVWHALKMDGKTKIPYVFFNDGDTKPDGIKRVGNTGGIYSVKTNKTATFYRFMNRCMRGGSGGDLPENNFEATRDGIGQFEGINRVILICDNQAFPRDVALLDEIHVPIDYILCGSEYRMNSSYVNLASKRAGDRLITIENSIANLSELKDGAKLKLGRNVFQKRRGRFWLFS